MDNLKLATWNQPAGDICENLTSLSLTGMNLLECTYTLWKPKALPRFLQSPRVLYAPDHLWLWAPVLIGSVSELAC